MMSYSNLNKQMTPKEIELKNALDLQIEFVLRLEEERLALLKETQTQKEQIRELMEMQNLSFGISVDTSMHDHTHIQDKRYQETFTQTEFTENAAKEEKKDTGKENNPKETANVLNQTQKNEKAAIVSKKKPLSERMPVKSLKLKPSQTQAPTERKEKQNDLNITKGKIETEALNHELSELREELETLRKENRYYGENNKSLEKERNEIKRELFDKDFLLDSLRKEVTELNNTVISNDYRTVYLLEKEVKKLKELNEELNEELVLTRREKAKSDEELKSFKEMVTKLRQEYEKESKTDTKVFEVLKECKRMELKIKELIVELSQQREENEKDKNQISILTEEKEKLESDVEYFKDMSRSAKSHAEKAIADVEYYRNMLRGMNRDKMGSY